MKKVVVIGRKRPERTTREITADLEAIFAFNANHAKRELDYDFIRKQRIEQEIADE